MYLKTLCLRIFVAFVLVSCMNLLIFVLQLLTYPSITCTAAITVKDFSKLFIVVNNGGFKLLCDFNNFVIVSTLFLIDVTQIVLPSGATDNILQYWFCDTIGNNLLSRFTLTCPFVSPSSRIFLCHEVHIMVSVMTSSELHNLKCILYCLLYLL